MPSTQTGGTTAAHAGHEHAARGPEGRERDEHEPPEIAEENDLLTHWRDQIVDQIRERPGRSLAIAVASGYIAGGGIGTILTARLLSFAARIALRLTVVPLLASEVERALFGTDEARRAAPSSHDTDRMTHDQEIDS